MAKWTEQRMAKRIADMWAWAENNEDGYIHSLCPAFREFDWFHKAPLKGVKPKVRRDLVSRRSYANNSICPLCQKVMGYTEDTCPCYFYEDIKKVLKERLALYGYEVVDE